MIKANSKSKLTLWVDAEIKEFGKRWSKKHKGSLSRLFSDYLVRLKEKEEVESPGTPLVNSLTGVIQSKKASKQSYKKHLEKKYL